MMAKVNDGLKIEKGIPVPSRPAKHGAVKAILLQMQPGDSVAFPCSAGTAYTQGYRHFGPGNFIVRAEGQGSRIWRIK